MKNTKKEYTYRLLPCPIYDIERIESWLTDMAKTGFILADKKFLFGFATFEKQVAEEIKYRLIVADDNFLFQENSLRPHLDALELNENFGWNYVSKQHQFYIYSTSFEDVREMHTDARVQSLTLRSISKALNFSVGYFTLNLILYATAFARPFQDISSYDSEFAFHILFSLLVLWIEVSLLYNSFLLYHLKHHLDSGKLLDHHKNWSSYVPINLISRITVVLILIAILSNFMIRFHG